MIDKYTPTKLNEIIGQDVNKILEWLENPRKKALLIHGPGGIGKTSAVYALAKEKKFEILEMNSSDFRKRDQIKNIIGIASQQQSLFGNKKLILIDEVDGISGRSDYGGLAELSKVIEKTKHPIILTGNEISGSKFNTLRRKVELLEFKSVDYLEIFTLLKKICEEEKIKYDEGDLKNLARKNGGDVRASLLDLERSIFEKKLNLEGDDREYKEKIEESLLRVFKSKDVNILKESFSNLNENLDEIFMWVDENLSKEYDNESLIKAYDKLSKADVYKGRILRRQYWRFLVYQSALMNVGIGLSKETKKVGFVDYKRPSRILKMWIAKQRNTKRRNIAEKFASKTHISKKKAYQELPVLVNFLKSEKVSKELELDDGEVNWLMERK
ncbi:MAG: hypothetical protein CMH63_01410 [Nanoarchaeota archaeon]|nr:hypothetical protein [Nanoarchaeota archaeon]|tara:strand:+ start:62679 stop:63833 length:1155 start_codon:yes stop_codon:yes gene_type:complete